MSEAAAATDEVLHRHGYHISNECMAALTALYLAVDKRIADDVRSKVEARIHQLREREGELRDALRQCACRCHPPIDFTCPRCEALRLPEIG